MALFVDVLTPFGLHLYSPREDENSKYYKKYVNLLNIISLFPVARPVVGVWRVFKHIPFVTSSNDNDSTVGLAQIARGLTELTVYGQWLIIPDVLATVLRAVAYLKARRASVSA